MPPLFILLLILLVQVIGLILIGDLKMKLSELPARLSLIGDRVDKVKIEVQKLKDIVLGDPDVPQAVVDQLIRVESAVGAVDDINEDETPPPPGG